MTLEQFWKLFGPAIMASAPICAILLGGLWRIGKWFGATQAQTAEFIKEQTEMKSDLAEIRKGQEDTRQSIIELRIENAKRDGLGAEITNLKERVHSLEVKRV